MAVAAPAQRRRGIIPRPRSTDGFIGWVTTIDHKKIGILYGVSAFAFLLLGGLEALLIRWQLSGPNQDILTADSYNQIFTMHGTTMVFLVIMPMGAAFFNFLIPLMIGARDVAFPRLNAFSYWVFLTGALFMYSSFFFGGMPDGGWFGYAPLSRVNEIGAEHRMDYWTLGLIILGTSSMAAAANFIVTILNLRAPGMTLMRMPVFVWMTLVISFLLITSMPVVTVGLIQLMFDRFFGANFFNPAAGGDPVLWQHLFWLFGHPEVYILILPAMGIVSEVLPTFSRKPLFGFPVVVFSGIAIGFMGWGVWAHHMFAVGLGPVATSAFAVSTMFIAVPTGVKIFNWLGTMWGGQLRFTSAMLFSIGFVSLFVIGGLSGVSHAIVPSDWQQTDTYYIVAHFHYVLFGGALMGLFSGAYYWWPKFTGKFLDETLGKVHFAAMFIGMNMTFGPMHILGLQGMPRRIYVYPDGMGWNFWNAVETIGALVIGAGILVFLFNVLMTSKKAKSENAADPWDGRTLEWSIPSPPPMHNFDEVPVVHARDDWWHRKYAETADGRLVRVPAGGSAEAAHHEGGHSIHMPSPSYWPLIAALGSPISAYGLIYPIESLGSIWQFSLIGVGALVTLAGLFGWALEPATEPED